MLGTTRLVLLSNYVLREIAPESLVSKTLDSQHALYAVENCMVLRLMKPVMRVSSDPDAL